MHQASLVRSSRWKSGPSKGQRSAATAHLFAFLAFGRREMGRPNSDTLSDKPRNSLVLTTGSETFLYLDPRAPCGAFSWNLRIGSCSVEHASRW